MICRKCRQRRRAGTLRSLTRTCVSSWRDSPPPERSLASISTFSDIQPLSGNASSRPASIRATDATETSLPSTKRWGALRQLLAASQGDVVRLDSIH